jgi:hypothetical protein
MDARSGRGKADLYFRNAVAADVAIGPDEVPVVAVLTLSMELVVVWDSIFPAAAVEVASRSAAGAPRIFVARDELWLAYAEGTPAQAMLREVRTGTRGPTLSDPRRLGFAFGARPVGFGATPDLRGLVGWQEPTTGAIEGLYLASGMYVDLRPTTEQVGGISRIVNGWPVLASEDYWLIPGLRNPAWANGCVVGEHETGIISRVSNHAGLVLPGAYRDPRLAAVWDGSYVVAAIGPAGLALSRFSGAELTYEGSVV